MTFAIHARIRFFSWLYIGFESSMRQREKVKDERASVCILYASSKSQSNISDTRRFCASGGERFFDLESLCGRAIAFSGIFLMRVFVWLLCLSGVFSFIRMRVSSRQIMERCKG